jgi:asparagine synthase (glutamine-hydrolysing)
MCGIVGAVDLVGRRIFPDDRLFEMTGAIAHRGPDDEQIHVEPGVALGVRRLAIIDIAGGRQPISNETRDVWVAFEGELYEYPDLREQLTSRGHRLATRCDTEAWVHLYEELGERVFRAAHGQFSVALWDHNERTLLLARDRVGIGPLFYAERDGWLLFASEIKGLLASGMVEAQPDVRGIDFFFHTFSMPNERTCFANIKQIPPGHYAVVKDGELTVRQYWDLDFPDHGSERRFADPADGAAELEEHLRTAVRRRLVGEVPVSCYLSGGLDSTVVLALSCQETGRPVPSFTVGLDHSGPADERSKAAQSARFFGSEHTIVNATNADIANTYPLLIQAAEGPVIDTASATLALLAAANRAAGNIVALTGEGADEALAGYVWFKARWPRGLSDRLGNPLERAARYAMMSALIGGGSAHRPKFNAAHDTRFAQQVSWEILAQSRERLYSPDMWARLGDYNVYDDLLFTAPRIRDWHPLNRSLYAAYKTMLPGLLLAGKGDRVLRTASTEGRYPFLDEHVIKFCSQIAPEYKLRGMTDKWLLRRVADRVAPAQVRTRNKVMFRANMSTAFLEANRPRWVDQLLSPESLRGTGYFDAAGVRFARELQARKARSSLQRFSFDMGLAGVISTQLWHHLYCGGGLCDLPTWTPPVFAGRRAGFDLGVTHAVIPRAARTVLAAEMSRTSANSDVTGAK